MDCPKGISYNEDCPPDCEGCAPELTVEEVFKDILGIDPKTGENIEDQGAEFSG